METGYPLIHGCLLDGKGGCSGISLGEADIPGLKWLHFDLNMPETVEWINRTSGLDPSIAEALTAQTTRPRYLSHEGGMLVILRGVNLNPGADPEDMVSIRIWVEKERIITLQMRKLMSTYELLDLLEKGKGPETPGAFLAFLLRALTSRMDQVITDAGERLDEMEDRLPQTEQSGAGDGPWELRREITGLRRYIAPQQETLTMMMEDDTGLLSDDDLSAIREAHDRATRFLEELASLRERALILHEETAALLSARMNRHAYFLTILAGLFIPLGFITGLLGINVGGIPLAESGYGFLAVCLMLAVLLVVEIFLLKRKKWF